MQFVHQALTWGFLLALAPLLIHLINMMRHRRVHWAAMEFLLASYKKHRTWIWLKQLLLLLARIAAVVPVVASPRCHAAIDRVSGRARDASSACQRLAGRHAHRLCTFRFSAKRLGQPRGVAADARTDQPLRRRSSFR